jgi:hypothetical protein
MFDDVKLSSPLLRNRNISCILKLQQNLQLFWNWNFFYIFFTVLIPIPLYWIVWIDPRKVKIWADQLARVVCCHNSPDRLDLFDRISLVLCVESLLLHTLLSFWDYFHSPCWIWTGSMINFCHAKNLIENQTGTCARRILYKRSLASCDFVFFFWSS